MVIRLKALKVLENAAWWKPHIFCEIHWFSPSLINLYLSQLEVEPTKFRANRELDETCVLGNHRQPKQIRSLALYFNAEETNLRQTLAEFHNFIENLFHM